MKSQGLNYDERIQQEILLMGWLMTSMTEEILFKGCACTTTTSIWTILAKVFASTSQVLTLQLRLTLQTTKKGDKSIEDYISQMVQMPIHCPLQGTRSLIESWPYSFQEDLAMNMILWSQPSPQDQGEEPFQLMIYRGQGLGLLLNHEIRLSKNILPYLENSFSMNYASKQRYDHTSPNSFNFNKFSSSVQKQNQKVATYSSVLCQIYEKRGHIASNCYKNSTIILTSIILYKLIWYLKKMMKK